MIFKILAVIGGGVSILVVLALIVVLVLSTAKPGDFP